MNEVQEYKFAKYKTAAEQKIDQYYKENGWGELHYEGLKRLEHKNKVINFQILFLAFEKEITEFREVIKNESSNKQDPGTSSLDKVKLYHKMSELALKNGFKEWVNLPLTKSGQADIYFQAWYNVVFGKAKRAQPKVVQKPTNDQYKFTFNEIIKFKNLDLAKQAKEQRKFDLMPLVDLFKYVKANPNSELAGRQLELRFNKENN